MTDLPMADRARGAGAAARVLQVGALAVVLAASTHRLFDLDRFFVTKELVLHVTALVAGLFAIAAISRRHRAAGDRLLTAFFLLSALSTVFATNRWAGFRALALTASSLAVYWIAAAVAEAGWSRRLVNALAFAVVAAATTSLIQAYGGWIELFSVNRAPGGTLGNRNFVAHAAAFGFPLVIVAALQARRVAGYLAASLGLGAVTAALVLTRSRAAWLAFGVMAAVFVLSLLAARALRRSGRTWARVFGLLLFIAAGIAAALLLPNSLRWNSDNPYLDTMRDVTNYEEGSGRGRLIQYSRSLVMALHHPILGVGPGNWSVRYPEHKARRDPSMDPNAEGATQNPWPSSDWIAFVSERGFAATILLGLALLTIATGGLKRMWAATDVSEALASAALLATLAAAVVAGLFDAVLLLPIPALIVWTSLGALNPTPPQPLPQPTEESLPVAEATSPQRHPRRTFAFLILLVFAAAGAWRSGAQLFAMDVYSANEGRESLRRAALVDPGNYRLQVRLARLGSKDARCRHALAARSLFPNAELAKRLARRCD